MSQNQQVTIQPLEDLVLAGLQSRFQQVFGCLAIHTSSTDKTKLVERVFAGKTITYPYAFITIQNISANTDSYNSNSLARNGLVTIAKDNLAYRTRIIPANFELEIEYVTNKFQGTEAGSVLTFIRRWLFARKNGYLKFNINYGRLAISISCTLSNSTTVPVRDNVLESESVYKITNTITLHGYISEPALGTIGIIQNIEVDASLVNSDGSIPGYQFSSFN
jgi:hypothetical protein